MTLQEQIDALLAEAAPLRLAEDGSPEANRLGPIVDQINALRVAQAKEPAPAVESAPVVEGADAKVEDPKRVPGRSKKAA